MGMNVVCLDMEGVLVPEIWIAFSEATGIPELRRTIRELDENAFVIVTETKNVFGRGFENIAEVR